MKRLRLVRGRNGGPQRNIYRNNMFLLLAVTCLPVLILSAVVYWVGSQKVNQEITSIQQKQIAQTARKIDEHLSAIESVSTQWAANPLLGSKLKDLETAYNPGYINDLYSALFTIEGSSPFIDKALLYLAGPGKIITHLGGVSQIGDPQRNRALAELLEGPKAAYWTGALGYPAKETEAVPAFVYKLPFNAGQPYAALIVTVKRSALSGLLAELNLTEQGFSQLKNERGVVLAETPDAAAYAELAEAMAGPAAVGARDGHASIRMQGEEYLVSYGSFKRMGEVWTYASASSLSRLTRPTTILSQLLLVLGLIGLATAVIGSLIASSALYRPIDRIHRQMRHIEQNLQEQQAEARRGYLLQLLHGHFYSYGEEQLAARLSRYGWNLQPADRYLVILFRLDNFSQSTKRFIKGDEQLAAFAAANIIGEIAQGLHSQPEVINFQDMSMALFMTEPPGTASGRQSCHEMADSVRTTVRSILGMELSVVISKSVERIREIPIAFEESRWLLGQRNPHAEGCLLDAEDYRMEEELSVYYPFLLEQEIIQAIRRDDEAEALRAIERFCRELKQHSSRETLYLQCLVQLVGSIRSQMLRAGLNPFRHPDSSSPQEQLAKLDKGDPREIVEWFRSAIVRPFLQDLRLHEAEQDHKIRALIERIVAKVQSDYARELSLDAFAEEHGVSGYTVSRWFRQATGQNFIDYLTEVRLEASKRLLVHSDLSIQDVAESVGYRSAYYYRIFKKVEGMTPSQYRLKFQDRNLINGKV